MASDLSSKTNLGNYLKNRRGMIDIIHRNRQQLNYLDSLIQMLSKTKEIEVIEMRGQLDALRYDLARQYQWYFPPLKYPKLVINSSLYFEKVVWQSRFQGSEWLAHSNLVSCDQAKVVFVLWTIGDRLSWEKNRTGYNRFTPSITDGNFAYVQGIYNHCGSKELANYVTTLSLAQPIYLDESSSHLWVEFDHCLKYCYSSEIVGYFRLRYRFDKKEWCESLVIPPVPVNQDMSQCEKKKIPLIGEGSELELEFQMLSTIDPPGTGCYWQISNLKLVGIIDQ